MRYSFRGQKLLTADDLSSHEDAPLERSAGCWRLWMKHGVEVDGELRQIPVKELKGIRYTSIEAIWLVIGDAMESQLPPTRKRRK